MFISVIVLFTSRISNWFLSIISVSYILYLLRRHSFTSLAMVSFSSLNILKADLKCDTRVSENATELAVLTKILLFFLTECSLGCCKPLFNFQNSVKVESGDMWQVVHCFYGGN